MHNMGDEKTWIVRDDYTQQLPAAHAHQRNWGAHVVPAVHAHQRNYTRVA